MTPSTVILTQLLATLSGPGVSELLLNPPIGRADVVDVRSHRRLEVLVAHPGLDCRVRLSEAAVVA
jgi:hypothetical protein